MLKQPTLDKLHQLRLHGMVRALTDQQESTAAQELCFDDRFGMIVDTEIQDRENRRQKRFLKAANLKVSACIEDVDYRSNRGLDPKVISMLSTCDWVKGHKNTIITAPTGLGKTYIGCALGNQAVRKGFSVMYKRLSRLLEELEVAYGDGSLPKLRLKISKIDLLILDDWALSPITARGRQELLEIVDDRIDSGSILIGSQLPVDKWHDYFGEPTVADAILDRLVHRAHRIELRGESLRKSQGINSASQGKE